MMSYPYMREPVFREVQQFRQRWLWVLLTVSMFGTPAVLAVVLIMLPGLNMESGETPIHSAWPVLVLMVIVGPVFLWFLWLLKLITEVREDGLYVRFWPLPWPLPGRLISFESIKSCEARTYRPIIDYGGWGIRWGPGGKAYNVSGNRGVQLELSNGKRLLIGSQRADELAEAIQGFIGT